MLQAVTQQTIRYKTLMDIVDMGNGSQKYQKNVNVFYGF